MRRLLPLVLVLGACRTAPPPLHDAGPPHDGLAELAAGREALAAGDLARARVHLESALRQSPSLGLAQVELADVLLQQGEQGPALAGALRAAQAQQPANPRTWLLSAADAENRGDVQAGIAALRQALSLLPQDTRVMRRLAALLQGSADKGEAAALYRQVLQLDPDDAASRLALAELLEARADLAGAELELTRLTAQSPGNALFRRKLEELLVREGKRAPPAKAHPARRALRPSAR